MQFPINSSKLDIAGVTVTYVQSLQVRFRSLTAETEHSWRERLPFYHPSIRLNIFSLSARLYEETSNSQYLSVASLSADFIINQLYNGVIIQDGMNLGDCQTSLGPYTYSSGLTIDGLSSLTAFNSSYASVYVSYIYVSYHSLFTNDVIFTQVFGTYLWVNTIPRVDKLLYWCHIWKYELFLLMTALFRAMTD